MKENAGSERIQVDEIGLERPLQPHYVLQGPGHPVHISRLKHRMKQESAHVDTVPDSFVGQSRLVMSRHDEDLVPPAHEVR
jgi:hypothetical protein